MQSRIHKSKSYQIKPIATPADTESLTCNLCYHKRYYARNTETYASVKHLTARHILSNTKLAESHLDQRKRPSPRYRRRQRKYSDPKRPLKYTSAFFFHDSDGLNYPTVLLCKDTKNHPNLKTSQLHLRLLTIQTIITILHSINSINSIIPILSK